MGETIPLIFLAHQPLIFVFRRGHILDCAIGRRIAQGKPYEMLISPMCSVFGLSSHSMPPLRHYRAGPFDTLAVQRDYWQEAIIAGVQILEKNTLKLKANERCLADLM